MTIWDFAIIIVSRFHKKGRSSIPAGSYVGMPGSGEPSDWSILTGFVNARALLG